jgi:hypothetical protein
MQLSSDSILKSNVIHVFSTKILFSWQWSSGKTPDSRPGGPWFDPQRGKTQSVPSTIHNFCASTGSFHDAVIEWD